MAVRLPNMSKTMRLPTKMHHCTITLENGYAVSYLGAPGFIDSTGTIPLQLLQDVAAALGFEGEPLATGSDLPTTEQVGPHAFRQSAEFSVSIGRRTAPHTTDYANPVATFEGRWESYQDYAR